MRRGDFAGAWQINDDVLASRDLRRRDDPALPYHLRWVWDGTPLANRHCLVRCYHGLGDTLQFARFLPLAARIATSVTVEAPAALCETLSVFAGNCHIVPFDVARPLPPGECDIEIMELAYALRVTDVGTNAHYLQRTPASAMHGNAPAIGICWQSGDWDRDRTLPPALLLNALERAAILPISLQRGTPVPPGLGHRLANPGDASMRIADTATLIGGLDLVVTVDGFVAHLGWGHRQAGAYAT